MIKYPNLLVIIDPDMEMQPALHRAVEIARLQDDATISLFMAIYDFSYEITSLLSSAEREEMRNSVIAQRQEWLNGLIAAYRDEGLKLESKVIWHSRPFEGIMQEVESHKYDLLITSAHQHSLLETFIFTPTDWHLIRKSPIPLLLVKEHDWPEHGAILLALNFSGEQGQEQLNAKLFREATQVAHLVKAKLHLVNSVPAPALNIALEVPGFTPELYSDALHQHHITQMEEFAARHHIPPEQTHVLDGLPEDVLPELARELDAELILIGCSGRTGWSAALIGNTAEQVVDNLKCDLLVVKPDPAPTT